MPGTSPGMTTVLQRAAFEAIAFSRTLPSSSG
jgi:hypothetical protein